MDTDGAHNSGSSTAYKGLGGGEGLVCRCVAFDCRIHRKVVTGSNRREPLVRG